MRRFLLILIPTLLLIACDPNGGNQPQVDDFDRQAMLTHWADKLIIPAFSELVSTTEALETAANSFSDTPNETTLASLRQAWETAYLQWQSASAFEVGKAEEVRLRDNLNIYPVDVEELKENVESGSYNLVLPSLNDSQGFPALDYLLYGVGESDTEILAIYTSDALAVNYRQYLVDLAVRINSLVKEVEADWKGDYRDTFVENNGSNANASVDLMVNDYIFYYEKHLRAGKVGIPAGVFSGAVLPENVEAYYRRDLSKKLLNAALDASQVFFNGEVSETGPSLKAYLDYLESDKDGERLSNKINAQFEASRSAIASLPDDFVSQLNDNEVPMLAAYDQLQLNVVLLKVDMLQALNVNVDYVDADGD